MQTAQVAASTGLVQAETPAQWAEQLQMLAGVRQALDVFQPIAFERSAADMIAATAQLARMEAASAEVLSCLERMSVHGQNSPDILCLDHAA